MVDRLERMITDGQDAGESAVDAAATTSATEAPLGRFGRAFALPLVPFVVAWDAGRALATSVKRAALATLRYLVAWWTQCWTVIARGLRAVFDPIVAAIATVLRWISEFVRSWVAIIVARLRRWAIWIAVRVRKYLAWVARIVDWCIDVVRRLVEVVVRLARIVLRPLVSVARWIRGVVQWTWTRVVEVLRRLAHIVRVAWAWIGEIIEAALRPLVSMVRWVVRVVESLARVFGALLERVASVVRRIAATVRAAWSQVVELVHRVTSAALAVVRRLTPAVAAMVRRLWQPIRAVVVAVVRAARSAVQAVLAPLRHALVFARSCAHRLRGGGAVWRWFVRRWRRLVAWIRGRADPAVRVVLGAKQMVASVRAATRRLARDAREQARSVVHRARRGGSGPDAPR